MIAGVNFTFKKEERLKSRKEIDRLFQEGQSFASFPLRVVWVKSQFPQSEYPIQFTVSVPKKKLRKAVQRNRMKRRIREAYRLKKHKLYQFLENEEHQYALMILFTGRDVVPYEQIDAAMHIIIKRLIKKWKKPIT